MKVPHRRIWQSLSWSLRGARITEMSEAGAVETALIVTTLQSILWSIASAALCSPASDLRRRSMETTPLCTKIRLVLSMLVGRVSISASFLDRRLLLLSRILIWRPMMVFLRPLRHSQGLNAFLNEFGIICRFYP